MGVKQYNGWKATKVGQRQIRGIVQVCRLIGRHLLVEHCGREDLAHFVDNEPKEVFYGQYLAVPPLEPVAVTEIGMVSVSTVIGVAGLAVTAAGMITNQWGIRARRPKGNALLSTSLFRMF